MPLFRQEVLDRHREKLQGDVFVGVPASWHIIGIFLLVSVLGAGTFLSFADYPRIIRAEGEIVPDKGVVDIVSLRSGIITTVAVNEGQSVNEGDLLVTISSDTFSGSGDSMADRMARSLDNQINALSLQLDAANADSRARRLGLDIQAEGIARELDALADQITLQEELIGMAQQEISRLSDAARRGIVPAQDLRSAEIELIEQRKNLADLQRSLAGRAADLAEMTRNIEQIEAQQRQRSAEVEVMRQALLSDRADVEHLRGHDLRAPVAGTVATLTSRPGHSVTPGAAVMSILPRDAELQAKLLIPTTAIGFVQPGQEVRLAIDTYPYQRFGTLQSSVKNIAQVPSENSGVSFYRAIVTLPQPFMTADARTEPLLPGMTLSGSIVTIRENLLERIFGPIFAVAAP